jgi:hypothetical protein
MRAMWSWVTWEISCATTLGQFGFALRGEQQAGVHADVAARHGKGVDAGVADDEEVEFALVARADRDQLVAELVEVGFDFGVVQIARVGVDVAHDRAASACSS